MSDGNGTKRKMKRNIMETNIISELTTFIEHAPTAFHAVAELKEILKQEGFEELKESEKWKIKPGKRYYVTRNNSSIIAVSRKRTGQLQFSCDSITQ